MTPTTSNDYPEWFRLGNPLMWGIPKAVYDFVSSGTALSTNHENAVRCATIHFIHCLNLSVESNRKGQHAVAICLCRQCAEALTVMEIGLIRDLGLSSSLLTAWLDGSKTSGATRKELAKKVWPQYGRGLWEESWSEFVAEFGQALHPYAHYTPELQSWQIALAGDNAHKDRDGNYLFLARVGLETYEANKATRVTLLHVLLSYILGRIVVENNGVPGVMNGEVRALGKAIAASPELYQGKINRHQQFWAHEFTNSNQAPQTAHGHE